MVSPVPNYSQARRDVIVAFIQAEGMLEKLDPKAVLIYTVLALIVDMDGEAAESALALALQDPSILQAANTLIERARSGS